MAETGYAYHILHGLLVSDVVSLGIFVQGHQTNLSHLLLWAQWLVTVWPPSSTAGKESSAYLHKCCAQQPEVWLFLLTHPCSSLCFLFRARCMLWHRLVMPSSPSQPTVLMHCITINPCIYVDASSQSDPPLPVEWHIWRPFTWTGYLQCYSI